MPQIPLRARDGSIRAYALVDESDYMRLSQWTWRLSSNGYARRGITVGNWREKRIVQIRMHREIMGLEIGDRREVDHINGDPLDNRRANLRATTHAENHQNRIGIEGAIPFRGVTFDRSRGKFVAAATIRGKRHNLGRFDTAELAAAAAKEFRDKHMVFAR